MCAFLLLISSCTLYAAKVVNLFEYARSYLDADLVIVGQPLSCTTIVVEEKNIPGNNGWTIYYKKLLNIHQIRIDSLMKGSYDDSTIVIQSESYYRHDWKSTGPTGTVNEKGDSLYEMVIMKPNGSDYISDAVIPSSGKFIILLSEKEGIYTSILCRVYDKYHLDFFRIVQQKGESYFKNPEFPLMEESTFVK